MLNASTFSLARSATLSGVTGVFASAVVAVSLVSSIIVVVLLITPSTGAG